MNAFDFQNHTRVIFGNGTLERVGEAARELGFRRTLLVSDHGLVACGHVAHATKRLEEAGIDVIPFHDFHVNPDTRMVESGRAFAAPLNIDSVIGLGGGSSLDCAKGINFLLTNGGKMNDYVGFGRASKPLLPMIGIPTTSGTGSEAQSYALISDADTHVKLACGDPKAAFRIAILDPTLTVSQPRTVTATAGFDALAHAVETYVSTKRNPLSELFSREAWRLLEGNYERVLDKPDDVKARGAMQLGAYYAGVAIENSMLGATHACANPLTKHYGTEHGAAIALMLPSVVRWNASVVEDRYRDLASFCRPGSSNGGGSKALAGRLEELANTGELPERLGNAGVQETDLSMLASEAVEQWTAQFNPREVDAAGALEIYQSAY
jgi:alcohol dehydrogenase